MMGAEAISWVSRGFRNGYERKRGKGEYEGNLSFALNA